MYSQYFISNHMHILPFVIASIITFGSSILTNGRFQVRVPSWTDRILFKTKDSDEIKATLHYYGSMDDIHSSDHKPVKAHICLKLSKPL